MNEPVKVAFSNKLAEANLTQQYCECIEADDDTPSTVWPMFTWWTTDEGDLLLRCASCGSKYHFELKDDNDQPGSS